MSWRLSCSSRWIDSQRHDRQPVHCAARRLRVQLRVRTTLNFFRSPIGCDPVIDLLDPIVSLLIVSVDIPLDFGNLGVGYIATSCDILFVPKQIVELMLLAGRCKKRIRPSPF